MVGRRAADALGGTIAALELIPADTPPPTPPPVRLASAVEARDDPKREAVRREVMAKWPTAPARVRKLIYSASTKCG